MVGPEILNPKALQVVAEDGNERLRKEKLVVVRLSFDDVHQYVSLIR